MKGTRKSYLEACKQVDHRFDNKIKIMQYISEDDNLLKADKVLDQKLHNFQEER